MSKRHRTIFQKKVRLHPMQVIAVHGRVDAHLLDDKITYEERKERSINRVRTEVHKIAELGDNYAARLVRGAVAKPR